MGDWMIQGLDNRNYVLQSRVDAALAILEAGGVPVAREDLHVVAHVARTFPADRRRPALSWSHHKQVTALRPEDQDRFLELAEVEGLSTTGLREQLRVEKHVEAA